MLAVHLSVQLNKSLLFSMDIVAVVNFGGTSNT